jgi:hypothetical protein
VKALRQLVETARSRQIDLNDFDDPSRPRSHHHHTVEGCALRLPTFHKNQSPEMRAHVDCDLR